MSDKQLKNFYAIDLMTILVIGISDGLSIPFVIVTGLSNVLYSTRLIALIGFIGVLIGAIAMGVSNYLSGLEELKERQIKSDLKEQHILSRIGLDKTVLNEVEKHNIQSKEEMVSLAAQYGWKIDEPSKRHFLIAAIGVSIAYMLSGIISILPYYIMEVPKEAMLWSVTMTLTATVIFGFIKAKLTGINPFLEVLRIVLIISIIASGFYFVFGLFR